MAPFKRSRCALDLKKKVDIINELSGGVKQSAVVTMTGLSQSTVATIWKNREKIQETYYRSSLNVGKKRKRLRNAADEEVERSVLMWISEARAKNVPMSGELIKKKAEQFAFILGERDNFKASNGWLSRFKSRHGISKRRICGEGKNVDEGTVDAWIETNTPEIFKTFSPKDIFNADETGLFFKALPNTTLALKGESCTGGKHSKVRITVLLCCNMDGTEKLPPLVIGKAKRPRCFRHGERFPTPYKNNKKAWMTQILFSEWLLEVDREMKKKKRKIVLLIDNCTAHNVDIRLENVKMIFFPPNCTAKIQPLDQGIIHTFKCYYRRRIVERILLNLDRKCQTDIDLKMAMTMLLSSWWEIKEQTIANCWKKAGFQFSNNQEASGDEIPGVAGDVSDDEWETEIAGGVDAAEKERCEELWNALLERECITSDESVSFEDFLSVDDSALSRQELTDEEIVETARSNPNSSEIASDEEQEIGLGMADAEPPSIAAVLDCLAVVRQYINFNDSVILLENVDFIERHVMHVAMHKYTQKTMNNFFQPM